MTTATQPSGFANLLAGLNAGLSDPSKAGLMGFAQGLLQAGAPHMLTPVPMGQAISSGLANAQAYRQQALQNAITQTALLPVQKAKSAAIVRSLSQPNSYAGRAYLDNALGGQAAVSNDPSIAGPATLAKTLNTLQKLSPSQRAYLLAKAFGIPAQGALPEGTGQNPDGSLSTLSGAPAAITANAFNKSGGAAAGSYPVNAALAYHTRAPGAAGATLGPRPAPFVPMGGAPSAPLGVPGGGVQPALSPAAIAAAQAAARQRQIGTSQGVSQAAQSANAPVPFESVPLPSSGMAGTTAPPSPHGTPAAASERWQTPAGRAQIAANLRANVAQSAGTPAPVAAPQAAAPQRPVLALPRPQQPAAGNGLVSPGLSPAQVELQKQAAQQTGAAESEGTKETEAAQAQLARLTEMQSALTQIPVGGNLAKVYAGVGDVLNYAGIKMPGLAAVQEFTKYRTNFVADAARKMGSKISYQEVGYIAKGVPDFTLAGNAPKVLLAQLQGGAQYDITRNQAMQYYANNVRNPYGNAYQGTTRGFEQWWQKTGVTPGSLMFMNTMFALPPADRSQYLQNFRSTATGKVYLQQYAKAQAFLRSNPGLVPFWSSQQ